MLNKLRDCNPSRSYLRQRQQTRVGFGVRLDVAMRWRGWLTAAHLCHDLFGIEDSVMFQFSVGAERGVQVFERQARFA